MDFKGQSLQEETDMDWSLTV